MHIALFVSAVLVVAGVLAEFGISTALTEVAAGILLGLTVDVSGMGWLDFLAEFGMLGLMFMAGFEVDPSTARRTWRASLGIGLASFVVPLAGVYAVCHWAFGLSPMVSLLVGTGLSTTSLALVYSFLRERELLAQDSGQLVLGAATVVDVASMAALALLFGNLGWVTVIFLLVAIPGAVGLPRLGAWVFARFRGATVEFELRFILLVLVGLGFLSERAGIHAAVVSFAAGLALSAVIQDHGDLEEKLKAIVFSFFAPVFFLRAGTRLDLRGVDAWTLALTAALLVVAVGLKFAGTAGAARLLAPSLARFTGILFNYRLTFGIITATVGLEEGLLDRRLFTAMMLIVLLSAVLPMTLLHDLPSELRSVFRLRRALDKASP